jgi:hypothetical protein
VALSYLDPRSEPGVPVEPYTRQIDPVAFSGTLTILANSFPDSVPFSHALAQEMARFLPDATMRIQDKGSPVRAAAPLNDAEAAALVSGSDALIGVYGH